MHGMVSCRHLETNFLPLAVRSHSKLGRDHGKRRAIRSSHHRQHHIAFACRLRWKRRAVGETAGTRANVRASPARVVLFCAFFHCVKTFTVFAPWR
jgi:hypothetical protein